MTLPDERYRALIYMREFALALLDSKLTPKVPRSIRQEAARCLRHYPAVFEIDKLVDDKVLKRCEDTYKRYYERD